MDIAGFGGTGVTGLGANGLPQFSTNTGAAGGLWSNFVSTVARGSNLYLDLELADRFGPSDQAELNDQDPAGDPSQPVSGSADNNTMMMVGIALVVGVIGAVLLLK